MPTGNYIRPVRSVLHVIGPSIAYIRLTQGQVALVDADDAEHLGQFNWHAAWSKEISGYYAIRNEKRHGIYRTVRMHTVLVGLSGRELVCDHRDSVRTLDNRRANLRVVDWNVSAANRRSKGGHESGVKGVYKRSGGYLALIGVGGRVICLGTKKTLEEAVSARRDAEIKYFGELAPQLKR